MLETWLNWSRSIIYNTIFDFIIKYDDKKFKLNKINYIQFFSDIFCFIDNKLPNKWDYITNNNVITICDFYLMLNVYSIRTWLDIL